jgi:predicted phosphodiesterase
MLHFNRLSECYRTSIGVFLGIVLSAGIATAETPQVDLIAAKQDQDARLTAVQQEIDAAKTKADSNAIADLEKKADAIRAEDIWDVKTGPAALELKPGIEFHPFNFAMLSDLHLSEKQGPERLKRAFELISKRHDLAFVIVLGDVVWDKNPEAFKPILASAGVPVHLVYGNNDWKWINDGTYEKAFGPRDYTFTYNNCTFIAMYDCLPKGHFPEDHKGDFTPAQWSWLEDQLKTAQGDHATHVFTAMHVPPATPGAFDPWFFMYTNTEKRFFDLLEKYSVTGALFGHLHQNAEWKHDGINCYVQPSNCWNFIARSKKVRSSFVRIVKVEQDHLSDALIPVRLEGETFTYDTLAKSYDAKTAPK